MERKINMISERFIMYYVYPYTYVCTSCTVHRLALYTVHADDLQIAGPANRPRASILSAATPATVLHAGSSSVTSTVLPPAVGRAVMVWPGWLGPRSQINGWIIANSHTTLACSGSNGNHQIVTKSKEVGT
jgi:hypothetical protein